MIQMSRFFFLVSCGRVCAVCHSRFFFLLLFWGSVDVGQLFVAMRYPPQRHGVGQCVSHHYQIGALSVAIEGPLRTVVLDIIMSKQKNMKLFQSVFYRI